MMPNVATPRRTFTPITESWQRSAALARDAAEDLAEEFSGTEQSTHYQLIAERISTILGVADICRSRLIQASPCVIERSGRSRSLIEMVEADPGDDTYRMRLAKILLRSLSWSENSISRRLT